MGVESKQLLMLADGAVDAFRDRLWDVLGEIWKQATWRGFVKLNERDVTALFNILENKLSNAIRLRLARHLALYQTQLQAKEEKG